MENQVKKREWVKNAAILLLAALLVLTFFSNTIMNRNLPEVATQAVTDGNINAKVRGTGTVTANGSHLVKAEQTREIRAVMIKAGQSVNAGDVLFVLGSGDSTELEEAQEKLYQLQLSYRRSALGGSSTDYSADEARLQAALDAYNEAANKVSEYENMNHSDMVERLSQDKQQREAKIQANEESILTKQNEISELQKELEPALAERDAYQTAYDDLVAQRQTDLAASENKRQDAIRAVREYYEHSGSAYENLETDLDDPEKKYQAIESDPEIQQEEKDIWKALADAAREKRDAENALAEVSRGSLDTAQGKVNTIQSQIDPLRQEIEDLESENEALRQEISQIEQEIAEHQSDSPYAAEYRAALEEKNSAYLSYLEQRSALEARRDSEARSNASLGLDLQDLNRQIDEQKEKIAKLSGGEENQILANVSGTVESVECTAGDTVAKDGVLCVIEVPDMGYTLAFSVTNDQAARLRVGDTATVSNYYWGTQINATLESIRVDPKNPQTNKLLTFSVTGDVNAGAELTISVGQRSANYETVVPKSAVRNDSNGYFVLKVESKNSPLGNRYLARRVSVEILAQDDASCAVTGDLGWGDYVITTSSAPLKNGDLVRLTD